MSSTQKIIVIGGSAGSLSALFRIFDALSPQLKVPILLVLHRVTGNESTLQELLLTKTHYLVSEIEEKEPIVPGHLYICPADYHVLVEEDKSFSLDVSEKVNFSRPSLDVVFKSAAEIYGEHMTAVLLSGANADGVAGLIFTKEKGGITIVQEPADAQVPYMPEQAIKQFKPDHVLDCEGIGRFLNTNS